ncbi:galactose-binding domain-like protein [Mucidula mucida]|nr:galactose-binding domain-like protein [Mucidula mucida]
MSLCSSATKIKVSSTLEKSTGKANLIDGNPETCWTSQQGLPQYIQLTFTAPVTPKVLCVTFQGGFVGTECEVQTPSQEGWCAVQKVYPEDVNREQKFHLNEAQFYEIVAVRLVFLKSSDFFGRITIYKLDLLSE